MSIDLTKKIARVCRSMHKCCICNQKIAFGESYFDGGYGQRAHCSCARKAVAIPVKDSATELRALADKCVELGAKCTLLSAQRDEMGAQLDEALRQRAVLSREWERLANGLIKFQRALAPKELAEFQRLAIEPPTPL